MTKPAGNRRGRDTRARILAAGDLCFQEHGLDLTLEQVAEAAGTTRMTVHRHTGGRERLVTHLVLRASNRLAELVGGVLEPAGPPGPPGSTGSAGEGGEAAPFADRLVEALVLTVTTVRATPALSRLFTGGDVTEPWSALDPDERVLGTVRDFYRPHLERAEAAGELAPGVDASEAVAWLLAQVLLVLLVPALAPGRDDVERFFRLGVPAVMAGPPGLG